MINRSWSKLIVGIIAYCMLCIGLSAETVRLTSLHWPPYSGQQLRNQGASVAVARAAFNAMGHQLEVDFYPWSRAVKLASKVNGAYVGYFPEYYFDTQNFVFSTSMGMSPLGLVEQQSHPISWVQLADLNQYTLGVVKDYVNTIELDTMIANGQQPVELVTSDENNIKKVAAARIDAAVIDIYVLRYLLNQSNLESLKSRVQMNRSLLANKHLYVAFQNTEQGRKWCEIYNQGLDRIDVATILAENLPE